VPRCADASLAEETVVELTRCIGLNLTSADACAATAFALSRQATSDDAALRAPVDACAQACAGCAEERERHAEHLTAGSAQKPVAPASSLLRAAGQRLDP
jgi:hypothetical protein